MNRATALLVAVLAGLSGVLAAAPPAAAHAALVGSDPADGSRLAAAPQEVRLTFTEPVDPRFASVAVSREGAQVPATSRVAGAVLTVALPPSSAGGSYDVAFRVVSTDGHPVAGRVGFTAAASGAGEPTPTAPTAPTAPTGPTAPSTADPTATATPTSGGAAAAAPSTRDLEGSGIASAVGWVIGGLVVVVVLVVLTVGVAALRRGRSGDRR